MRIRIALGVVAAIAVSATCASAAPVSASAGATASIVAPNTLNATRALAFGMIAKPTTGTNTVTVASAASGAATPTLSGGGNAFIPTSGQAAAATFRLVGTPGQTYSVQTSTLSFTGQAGNLSNVGPEAPLASLGALGTLPGGGLEDLFIGGHIDISATTTVQTYTGALALTINFD